MLSLMGSDGEAAPCMGLEKRGLLVRFRFHGELYSMHTCFTYYQRTDTRAELEVQSKGLSSSSWLILMKPVIMIFYL